MEGLEGDCKGLKIDQACVTIVSVVSKTIDFLWQSDECEDCDLIALKPKSIKPLSNASYNLDTRFGSVLKIQESAKETQTCLLNYHFIDTGKYFITTSKNLSGCDESKENCLSCNIIADAPSQFSTYLPAVYALIAYLSIALIWILLKIFHRRGYLERIFRRRSQDFTMSTLALDGSSRPDIGSTSVQNTTTAKRRLKSLDTFRGVAIVIMIFVNYGGGKYFFFDHLSWNGLTVADLVFPWFIWIMGVSMALSMRSLIKQQVPRKKIFFKIIKRSCILFSLGIILNTSYGANDLSKLRIPGVLQRFAISYFVVATVHMYYAKAADVNMNHRFYMLRDIWEYWMEWLCMLSLLILQIVITFAVSAPGCPKGYLGPGGLHEHGKYENCTGGASGYIDRLILGNNHIYQHPTLKEVYKSTLPYDPEGILGCLTSIFLVFLGLQAGKILLTYKQGKERILRWLAWAALTGTISLILCKASKNDGWIPVNKNLWSVSYILTTGSMAFLLLSFCYYIQDIKVWWTGSPFFYAGMNSILLYVGHQLTTSLFPWSWKTEVSHSAYLGVNLWGCSLWVLISYALYKKKIFLAI